MAFINKILIQCKGPRESDWSTLTTVMIDPNSPRDAEAAKRRAMENADHYISAWQRNYQGFEDHMFRKLEG